MTARERPEGCPVFTMFLKERTPRKRLCEAKRGLEGLYPFEVDEKNILMFKTDRKGVYEVYLSREEIEKKPYIMRTFIVVFSAVLVLAGIIAACRHASVRHSELLRTRRELEVQMREEAKRLKEKEKKLAALKEEYEEKKKLSCEKIYPYIERMYSAMTEKTTVENISIQKNDFSVEVTTRDAVGILRNFEESRAFSSVKMNRTTVRDGRETVTYSGSFSAFLPQPDEGSSVDGKIEFYESEIMRMENRLASMRSRTLSEYIKEVRNSLHENSCSEQYIQIKGKDDHAEIEFFILSGSRGILNFIRAVQQEDESLFDVKSFMLRNSEDRGRLQTTVCFDTGIELRRNDGLPSEYDGMRIEPSEIDRIFYKSPSAKVAAVKKVSAAVSAPRPAVTVQEIPAGMKRLSYVGLTKTGGRDYVIAKDDDMGSIYKLLLSKAETSGDFCILMQGGYRARIRGEYYEVKK